MPERHLSDYINPATQSFLRASTDQHSCTLEIGCGPGQYRKAVYGRYVGVDITADNYYPDLPRTPDVVAGAARLPFRDAAFDVVFFSNTFHFLPADLTIKEAVRVLRVGGQLVLFDYSRRTLERLRAAYERDRQNDTTVVRTSRQWMELLRQAGLNQVHLKVNSLAPTERILSFLNIPLLRWAYFAGIDARECAIVAAGYKL
jgi:SAM-dependent methyltransferase